MDFLDQAGSWFNLRFEHRRRSHRVPLDGKRWLLAISDQKVKNLRHFNDSRALKMLTEWFSVSRNEPIQPALENNKIFASFMQLPLADRERSSHNGSVSVVEQHLLSKANLLGLSEGIRMARKRRGLNAEKQSWRCVAALCGATMLDARRAILVQLSTGPFEERVLAKVLRVRLPVLKRHLKRLAKVELVTVKNAIGRRTYRLGPRTRVRSENGRLQLDVSTTDGSRLTMTIAAPVRQR